MGCALQLDTRKPTGTAQGAHPAPESVAISMKMRKFRIDGSMLILFILADSTCIFKMPPKLLYATLRRCAWACAAATG